MVDSGSEVSKVGWNSRRKTNEFTSDLPRLSQQRFYTEVCCLLRRRWQLVPLNMYFQQWKYKRVVEIFSLCDIDNVIFWARLASVTLRQTGLKTLNSKNSSLGMAFPKFIRFKSRFAFPCFMHSWPTFSLLTWRVMAEQATLNPILHTKM